MLRLESGTRFSLLAEDIHTIVLLECINIIPDSVLFWLASSPTNVELLKPFNHQNVQLFKDILLVFFSFLSVILKYSAFSAKCCPFILMEIFQISFCYNLSIRSTIETIQLLKCSAF